jgi:Tol biopolymer transport system component
VIAASICAFLGADVPAEAGGSGRPVYSLTDAGTDGRLLTRRDPATLAPIGPSARLNGSSEAAAFSPDGSLLAFVEWASDRPSLRVLELSRMRWRTQVPLGLATGTVVVVR